MSKSLQRKKPGYTKSGVAKIVSMNGPQLVKLLTNTSKKKQQDKIERRIKKLGYVVPTVVEVAAE
jgi:hypothetical protein